MKNLTMFLNLGKTHGTHAELNITSDVYLRLVITHLSQHKANAEWNAQDMSNERSTPNTFKFRIHTRVGKEQPRVIQIWIFYGKS